MYTSHASAFSALMDYANTVFGNRAARCVGHPDWSRLPSWEYSIAPADLPRDPNQESYRPAERIELRWLGERPIPHGHFLSYGLSDLYTYAPLEDRMTGNHFSGHGLELSFRFVPVGAYDENVWFPEFAVELLQKTMAYVVGSGRPFAEGHFIDFESPNVPGLAFLWDQDFQVLMCKSGMVNVVQLYLLTEDELRLCQELNWATPLIEYTRNSNPDLVSFPDRASVLSQPGAREAIVKLSQELPRPAAG